MDLTLQFSGMAYDGTQVWLKEPYTFKVKFYEGYYIVDDGYLDMHICEQSIEDVKRCINQEFIFLYKAYAKELDRNLTSGAQKFKRKLWKLIA